MAPRSVRPLSPTLHFIFRWPAQDRNWEALCLEYDVMTFGTSFEHAQAMLAEAMDIVLTDDEAKGFDPNERRSPPEDWAEFDRIMQVGRPITLDAASPALRHAPTAIALTGTTVRHEGPPPPRAARRRSSPPIDYANAAAVWV